MVHYNKCPICDSSNLTFYIKCKDTLVSGKEFDLYQCAECNFTFTQDHPGEKEIGNYYRSGDYISHSDTTKGIFNTLYHFVRRLMLRKKKRIITQVSGLKTGSILDIGSGTGYFAYYMKQAGWTVTGIEPNETARMFSIDKFGINVLNPEAIKNLSKECFDCITLWHVLEHLEYLDDYLLEIRRLLKPGGICLVALPNHRSFDAKYYKQFWAAYDVPRHLWHFSPDTFHRLTNNYRFSIIGKIPLRIDAFYISILSEKNKREQFPIISGWFTGLKSYLISIFQPERNSSLVYLLKKQ
jgi:2-polyprenyl-3-methyl-5-hydroxy-6-metoxy-1,4-benzoquinol methylase